MKWKKNLTHPWISGFLGLYIDYYNDDWVRKSLNIGCPEFSESHTGENIWKLTRSVLDEWGILFKTHVGLRDSAENVKKALNIGNLETLIVGISCLIHLLQLCLKENLLNLPSVKAMVEKFRRASQLENQSQAFHNEFHKQQKVLNPEKKPVNLIQDVSTRFNSYGH